MHKLVSVIIPAYNEGEGIEAALEELTAYVALDETEIIVVDDGSTDDTAEKVAAFPEVRLIRHGRNQGYGAAIKTGTRAAGGEIIAWYDADGQHRPEDLVRVVEELQEKELDYCIGVRGKDSYEDHNRVFGKFILRMFLRVFARQTPGDFNSGLRAFRRSVLIKYLSLLPRGFGASTVTTLLMQEEGYLGSEVPITVRKRVGKSSVKQFRDGMRTILLILNVILLFHPMRVFGGCGMVLVLVGAVYGSVSALAWRGGLPVMAAVLILFGFQLFCFGLLSLQISRMRKARLEELDMLLMHNAAAAAAEGRELQ